MTLAVVIALVAPLSTGAAGRGFEIPRLSWPPSPSPGPKVQVEARKMSAPERKSVRPTVTCTMRVVPADPGIDPKIGREAPPEVDSAMTAGSRCSEPLPPGLP